MSSIASANQPTVLASVQPWKFKKSTNDIRKEMDMFNVDCLARAYSGPELYSEEAAHLAVFLELLEQKYLHK